MTGRLFDVNVLARFHCRNSDWGMPVVWSGYYDSIYGFVVEELAEIAHHPGSFVCSLVHQLAGPLAGIRIHVADRDDVGGLYVEGLLDMGRPHAAHTNNGQSDLVIGRDTPGMGCKHSERRSASGHAGNKISPGKKLHEVIHSGVLTN